MPVFNARKKRLSRKTILGVFLFCRLQYSWLSWGRCFWLIYVLLLTVMELERNGIRRSSARFYSTNAPEKLCNIFVNKLKSNEGFYRDTYGFQVHSVIPYFFLTFHVSYVEFLWQEYQRLTFRLLGCSLVAHKWESVGIEPEKFALLEVKDIDTGLDLRRWRSDNLSLDDCLCSWRISATCVILPEHSGRPTGPHVFAH